LRREWAKISLLALPNIQKLFLLYHEEKHRSKHPFTNLLMYMRVQRFGQLYDLEQWMDEKINNNFYTFFESSSARLAVKFAKISASIFSSSKTLYTHQTRDFLLTSNLLKTLEKDYLQSADKIEEGFIELLNYYHSFYTFVDFNYFASDFLRTFPLKFHDF